jgi:hypothetical protein
MGHICTACDTPNPRNFIPHAGYLCIKEKESTSTPLQRNYLTLLGSLEQVAGKIKHTQWLQTETTRQKQTPR